MGSGLVGFGSVMEGLITSSIVSWTVAPARQSVAAALPGVFLPPPAAMPRQTVSSCTHRIWVFLIFRILMNRLGWCIGGNACYTVDGLVDCYR